MQDFNSFFIVFYYFISTICINPGDLFCPVILLDFRSVCKGAQITSLILLLYTSSNFFSCLCKEVHDSQLVSKKGTTCRLCMLQSNTKAPSKQEGLSPFEWVPEHLGRFLTDPTLAKLLEHPGQ